MCSCIYQPNHHSDFQKPVLWYCSIQITFFFFVGEPAPKCTTLLKICNIKIEKGLYSWSCNTPEGNRIVGKKSWSQATRKEIQKQNKSISQQNTLLLTSNQIRKSSENIIWSSNTFSSNSKIDLKAPSSFRDWFCKTWSCLLHIFINLMSISNITFVWNSYIRVTSESADLLTRDGWRVWSRVTRRSR